MTADLLLEKRKIVAVRKNRRRKRIPETRDSWEETVTKTADEGGWKEQNSAHVMLLPGEWLEDAPWVGYTFSQVPVALTVTVSVEDGKRGRLLSKS